jgi:hypothetical protein
MKTAIALPIDQITKFCQHRQIINHREHPSFAFTVLSPLACYTIRERGQHYKKKMLFTKMRCSRSGFQQLFLVKNTHITVYKTVQSYTIIKSRSSKSRTRQYRFPTGIFAFPTLISTVLSCRLKQSIA